LGGRTRRKVGRETQKKGKKGKRGQGNLSFGLGGTEPKDLNEIECTW